jgi:peptidoglycan/LPS O-acetylase OafA/YrhL
MPGSIFTLISPLTRNTVLFGLFDYVVPIMLYCAWSALAFLDLARANGDRGRTWRWSLAILLLPVAGAAAYLVWGSSPPSRRAGVAFVTGGLAIMVAAFAITLVRIS